MSKKNRDRAEQIIVEALQSMYPNIKFRPNTGNYVLNKLLKAGYTNDKITIHVEEVKEELEQAVFKCKVDCGPECYEDDS